MKNLITTVLVIIGFFGVSFSQKIVDTYQVENDGYFAKPTMTAYGIVATDNYASVIYLFNNGNMQEILATPTCGQYFSVSPDGKKIGFKFIEDNGKQAPALLDIASKKITKLHAAVKLCGDVSFTSSESPVFTIGNDLLILDTNLQIANTISIGFYVNLTPISPTGNFVAFSDNKEQMQLLEISTGKKINIANDDKAYVKPLWSPDGNLLQYTDFGGNLFVFDVYQKKNYFVAKGTNPCWTRDSKHLLYHRTEVSNFKFLGSDIYISSYDGTSTQRLTSTPDVDEMDISLGRKDDILFHTYSKREIISAKLTMPTFQITSKISIYKSAIPLQIHFYNTLNYFQNSGKSTIQFDVPYVHQKYDTPDWHAGGGSCAPTTAIMALAYFNILPKWPITCSSPYVHTNDFGSYVADKYNYNEVTYADLADAYGTNAWGGYGYMWSGSYSPNSRMAQYLTNHGPTGTPQYWTSSCTYAKMVAEIDAGYPQPLCNYLTSSGHLILGIGYIVGQNTVITNDPYGNKNNPGYPNYTGKNSFYDWPGFHNGYINLDADGSHGYVAWTVKARGTMKTYKDTLIDDVDYNHGFYVYNQAPAHMKFYHDKKQGGYNGHYWFTYTSTSTTVDTCYVQWTPTIPSAGNYEVFANIPSANATATAARYKVYYNGGNQTVIVNQATHNNQWVSLGTYNFAQGATGYVRLGDAAGAQSQMIAFDAMRFSKRGITLASSTHSTSCYNGSDGYALVSPASGNAPYSYVWSTIPAQHNDTASGLIAGTYSVTVTDASMLSGITTVTIAQPTQINVSFTTQSPSIIGASDGTVTAVVTGGAGDYQYTWNTQPAQHTAVATGLLAGTYTVSVTDLNACLSVNQIVLADPPLCGYPAGLASTGISSFAATLNWNTIGNATSYILRYKRSVDSNWNYLPSITTSFFLTGLAVNTLYNWEVAALCTSDTSAFTSSTFTTATSIASSTVTSCTGFFRDSGGENGNYNNNENYTFTIDPTSATSVTVQFSSFFTEASYDTLFAYNGLNTSSPLIGAFTGTAIPSAITATSGKLTFKFYSDNSTVKTGWNASWFCNGTSTTTNPVCYIDSSAVQYWYNDDFRIYYGDIDNSGRGLKNKFYQVLEKSGSSFTSNTKNGFFYDNFSSAQNPAWIDTVGTWTSSNGLLHQTDTTNVNTNIYIPVTQDSLLAYMYSFRFKVTHATSNSRIGMYVFCGNPNTSERYNSYLIWCKMYNNKFAIWKNVNNTDYKVAEVGYTYNYSNWYDVKFIVDPVAKKVSGFINGVMIASYNDPTPVMNGGYISLRTYQCAADFDDINVYKSRIDSTSITVGNLISDDIRIENANPISPAGVVKTSIIDNNYNFSNTDTHYFNIDRTAPTTVLTVNDGSATDIDTSAITNQLSANWTASTDANSDIKNYWYCIGTAPGSNNFVDWVDNAMSTNMLYTGLYLSYGQKYYITVKAENNAGLISVVSSSDGVVIVNPPIVMFSANTTEICRYNNITFSNSSQNAVSWNWIFEGGTPANSTLSNPSVSYSSVGTFNVTLIATGLGGTDSLVQTNYILVNDLPAANAGLDTSIQYGSYATLHGSVNTGNSSYTYQWAPADSLLNANLQNPRTINLQNTTVFTLTATDNNTGCAATDQTMVIVTGSALTATINTSAQTICEGNSVQLNVLPNGGSGTYTYQWSSSPAGLFSTSQNPEVTPNINTTYTVTVTSGVSTAISAATINVQQNPTVYIQANGATSFCDGSSVMLDATASGVNTYSWYKNGVAVNGAINSSLQTSESGDYTVVVANANACSATSNSITVTANPIPAAFAGNDISTLINDSVTLQGAGMGGSGSYTYLWSPANLLVNATVQNPTTAALAANTTFTLTVTDLLSGCQNTDQVQVSVSGSVLSLNTYASVSSICEGASVQLTADAEGGIGTYSLQWASDPAGFSSTIQNPIVVPSVSTTYFVTVTSGANTAIGTINVAVYQNPIADIQASGVTTFCDGDAVTLNSTTGSGYAYAWLKNAYPITAANTNTFTATISGNYAVILTNLNGCVDTSNTVDVIVNPLPVANAGNDFSVSYNSATSLQGSASGGSGNYSYLWSPANLLVNATVQNPQTVSLTATSLYTLTVTDLHACQSTDQVMVAVIGTVLSANASASPNTICAGNTVQLSVLPNGGNGSYTYQWNSSPVGFSSGLQNPVVSPFVNTTYNVTVTSGANSATAYTAIVVNANPMASIQANGPISFCEGNSVILNSTIGSGLSYNWLKNGISLAAPNTASYTTTISGNYSVIVSNTSACADTSAILTITANPIPTANAGTDVSITINNAISLQGSANGGSGNYLYTWAPANLLDDANVQNPHTAPLSNSTIFTLTVTDSQTSCQNTDQMQVTVTGSILSVTANTSQSSFCQGGSAQIYAIASGGNGNYTYSWTSVPAGFTSTLVNPTVSPTVSTTYTVQVFSASNTAISNVSIVVNPKPTAVMSLASNVICYGDSANFHFVLTGTAPWTIHYLNDGNLSQTTASTSPFDIFTKPVTNTTYTLTSVSDAAGCTSTAINTSQSVTVNLLPIATFAASDTLVFIPNGMATFVNNSANAANYTWNFGDGTTSTDQNPWHVYTSVGYYTITLIATSATCGNDTSIMQNYIHVTPYVGIENLTQTLNVSISPNPFHSRVQININNTDLAKADIKIYDALGRELIKQPAITTFQNFTIATLDFEKCGITSGIYYCRISTNEKQAMLKLIKY